MINHEDQINQFISEYNDKNHQNLKAKMEIKSAKRFIFLYNN